MPLYVANGRRKGPQVRTTDGKRSHDYALYFCITRRQARLRQQLMRHMIPYYLRHVVKPTVDVPNQVLRLDTLYICDPLSLIYLFTYDSIKLLTFVVFIAIFHRHNILYICVILRYHMYDTGQLITACAIYKSQLLKGNTYETKHIRNE